MQKSNQICLLLGSNLGDKIDNILSAEKSIGRFLKITKTSSFYGSQSWGYDSNNSFVNRAVLVETNLNALKLLRKLQKIEKSMGRIKNAKKEYQDRLIDIDILTFNNEQISLPDLVVPHPRIAERRFAILPLLEIYKDVEIPGINMKGKQLLANCADKNEVIKINV